ncbi:MAG: hypothetical protein A4E70_02470 [Syntrophus sp. PtaU1.Bin005]|nr:MAG: hypothetical protein A4E70_02470 [Syntrophus sp. PtaU1.Bin005]
MSRSGCYDRQPVLFGSQGEGEGVVFKIGVHHINQLVHDRPGGILAAEGHPDVGIHEFPVAFFGFGLQPGRETPSPGRGADQLDRPFPPQKARLEKGQIEARCNKPSRTRRRSKKGRYLVQGKPAIANQLVGFPACFDADAVHGSAFPAGPRAFDLDMNERIFVE